MPSLFLSHAGVDSDAAIALAKRIEESPEAVAAGLQVWIDKADLRAGRRWKGGLQDALGQSTAFAVYVGSRGIVNWVQDEVDVALDKAHDPNDPGYPLIPVLAPGIDPRILPSFLSQFQGVANVERDGEAFNRLLRAVLRQEPRAAVRAVDEPFVGLQAFDSSKAHLFFGRETDVDRLVGLLRGETLVMVTGDSGSGKSSLVKAGLVPAFRGGCLGQPRDQGLDETIWQVVETRPGSEPFGRFADDLRDTARRAGIAVDEASKLAAMVRPKADTSPSPDAVRDALLSSLPADIAGRAKFLVVVDQFEEFRTATAAGDYVAALLRLAAAGDDRIRVVLTMRRDYYFACASFPPLYTRLEANDRRARMVTHRMTKEHLREAVSEPLRLTGTPDAQGQALADAVIRDAGDEAGELAVLQFALWRTWQMRKDHGRDLLAAYNALGRVEGALANEAEHIFTGLPPDEQARAETLFIRLVRPGEAAGVTRRIARLAEFEPATQALAQKLSLEEQSRLLTLGEDTVEIAHEQLATQWGRYQGWIGNVGGDRRGDDLRVLQRLIDAAAKATADDDLARGGDLADFERLANARPAWLSSVEQKFVIRSKAGRKREKREREERVRTAEALAKQAQELASTRRWQLWGSVAATLALLVFAVFAGSQWWAATESEKMANQAEDKAVAAAEQEKAATADALAQKDEANRQRGIAEQNLATANRALASAIWNDLPVESFGVLPVRSRNALWQLATGRSSLATPFLAEQASAVDRSVRFSANANEIMRAIGGASGFAAEQAQTALGPVLAAITTPTGWFRFEALDTAVAALAPKLEAEQAQTALGPVLGAITTTSNEFRLEALAKAVAALAPNLEAEQARTELGPVLAAIPNTTDGAQLEALGAVVAALTPKLEAEQARTELGPVLAAIPNTTDGAQLEALMRAVVALAPSPEQARTALGPVLAAIPNTTDGAQLRSLMRAVTALAPKLEAEQARTALGPVLAAITTPTGWFRFEALNKAVAALAPKLEAEQARTALGPILAAIPNTTDWDQLQALAMAVVALAPKLEAEQARTALVLVLAAIPKPTNESDVRPLMWAVAALAPKLEAEQAQTVLGPVLAAITSTTGWFRFEALAKAVAALAPKLEVEQAQTALVRVLAAIPKTTDGVQLAALMRAVVALAPSPEQARTALGPLIDAISNTTDGYQLQSLVEAVAALAPKLEAEQARTALVPVLDAIPNTTDGYRLRSLMWAVAALAPKLEAEQARTALVPVLDAIPKATDWDQLRSLVEAVAALAPKLEAEQAQTALGPVLDAIPNTTNEYLLRSLTRAVAALAPSPEQARTALVPVLDAIPNTTDWDQLEILGEAVAALAPKLEAEQAQTALGPVLAAISNTTDRVELAALGEAVAALTPKLEAEQARTAMAPLIDTISNTTNLDQLQALAMAVQALAPQLEGSANPSATAALLAALAWAPSRDSAAALAAAYAALLPRVPEQAFVTAVSTPIGFPMTAGPATNVLIETLREVGGPGNEAGLDATLAWLREPSQAKAYPDIDAVPACPPPPAGWEGLQCPLF